MRRAAALAALSLCLSAAPAAADRIALADGGSFEGKVLFYTDGQVAVAVDGGVRRVALSEVTRIDFDPLPPGQAELVEGGE